MVAESSLPRSLVTAFKDQYELLREVGHGAAATVYQARDLKHDRLVAIKVLHGDVSRIAGDRFLREIRVSAKMQHPNVLPTYDSGLVDGRLYFVMPSVDGGSLRERLLARKSLPITEALTIARQVGVALSHAHALGIIHRDVKPENILFYHGTACLADFGIARPLEELEPGVTAHGTLVGTPGYMSPEQFLTGFDGRSDIYSLCCVLYEMIAGAKLFSGNTPQELVERRSYLLAKSREEGPPLPDYIDALLDRGLARAPHHRFDDADEFVEAVDDALAKAEKPRRDSGAKRALRSMRRRKIELGVAVAAVAVVALVLWPTPRGDRARGGVTLQGAPAPVSDTPFETGKAALDSWDVSRAQAELAAAVAREPSNIAARLWLAQSHALARRTGNESFRVAARQLESYRSQLHGRDSLLAEGLVAIAGGRPAAACPAYAAQLHRDTLDVLAWYGLGDCQSLDSSVVRDARSPSGWRFVASYEAAGRAYRRVVELAPGARRAVPFSLMTRLLPVSPASVRRGRAVPEGVSVLAYPSLDGDTLAFTPYPLAVFQAVAPATISPTWPQALARNQEILLGFAREWVESSPASADAWESLALAREIRGLLDGGDNGADAALRNARKLTDDQAQQARLAAAQARIQMKEGNIRAARVIADSIFKATKETPATESAEVLAGLAALTGRIETTATMHIAATTARYSTIGVAPPLAAAGSRYLARAAAGVCDDSLRTLRRDFEKLLDSYAAPNRRATVRQLVTWQAAALSFPCVRAGAFADLSPATPLDRAHRAFAAGDFVRMRGILDSAAALRVGFRPGDLAMDFTVQEAWLRAAAGDTATAERQLDVVLDALPTLNARTAVLEVAQSAALGRAMLLRADLAAARHDTGTAKRWARGVVELWASADPALKPAVERMRALAR